MITSQLESAVSLSAEVAAVRQVAGSEEAPTNAKETIAATSLQQRRSLVLIASLRLQPTTITDMNETNLNHRTWFRY
jgi:hypothetical protein